MDTTQQFSFLQGRIEEIGSAIFYNLSESVLKIPTSIVTSLKVDDYGFVWFSVQRPPQHLNEFEQEFPVKLDFYKKGKGYFLQVAGKGFVVNDPEEMFSLTGLPETVKSLASSNTVLIKVKIQKADYYQTRTATKTSWWQNAFSTISTWLGVTNFRPDSMYFPAS